MESSTISSIGFSNIDTNIDKLKTQRKNPAKPINELTGNGKDSLAAAIPEHKPVSEQPRLSYIQKQVIDEQNKKTGGNYSVDIQAAATNIQSLNIVI